MITTDIDERDKPFLTGERTQEGFYRFDPSTAFERCVARGLAYAEYADMLWMETSKPDLAQARRFAQAIHAKFPGKLLAYNCSPSFNWSANLPQEEIAIFQRELASMGYKFQFVTLAGFHALNHSMYTLARGYRDRGMAAYCELQNQEFADEANGYTATKHQREVGTGWFDAISTAVRGGASSTTALTGSTEEAQFKSEGNRVHAAE
jgi:isocitrate lyase